MKHFAKELPNQPFWYADGTKANYTVVTGSIGLIELDDSDPHAKELEEAAKKHVAGVVAISQEAYEAKKKLMEEQISNATPKEPEPPKFRLVFPGKEALIQPSQPAPAVTAGERSAAGHAAAPSAQPAAAPAAPPTPEPQRQIKTVKPKTAKLKE